MKKLQIAAVMAATALAFIGCNSCSTRVPQANMHNAIDSISYMRGLAQGNNLKNHYLEKCGIDSANIEDFIQGFLDGAMNADDLNKNAYCQGEQFGRSIVNNVVDGMNYELFGNDSTKTISIENLIAGYLKGMTEKNLGLTDQEISAIIEKKDSIIKAEIFAEIREAGMTFLAENAKKEGIIVTESGLQYRIITEGTGQIPDGDAYVKVKYVGKFIDGTEFDSSRDEFLEMKVNRNIKGFAEALMLMPVGSKWEIYIPYNLAFGKEVRGNVKPYSTLIYEVELDSIR